MRRERQSKTPSPSQIEHYCDWWFLLYFACWLCPHKVSRFQVCQSAIGFFHAMCVFARARALALAQQHGTELVSENDESGDNGDGAED